MHNHPSVDKDNSEVQTTIQRPPEENASLLPEDWSVRQPRTRRRVVQRPAAPQRMEVDVATNLNPSRSKEQEIVEVDIKGTKRKLPENSIMKV
ncbi:hypothetical protein L1987_07377 [Smallanthus sonchifolius]|uniref:Uncharacterized protein n=1 Tax=Smallanthus sonchifolius TaxID=185202 RepID=A0ACB9K0I7_9ASTR|nr:hypothetical protein L1987_07377 [Smallanthus sonchifolius]